MNDTILGTLRRLPKEWVLTIILELMREDKITFSDIAQAHTRHLEELHKGQSQKLQELVSKVISMHCDTNKNHSKNLSEIMHYLLDEGRVNTTHEDIDKKYKIK